MKCKNCKHWVEGYCMVTGSLVDKDVLCNAWELSLSWEQVAETQPATDRTAELQERIDKLERDAANNASSIHNIMTMLDINDETEGYSYDMFDTALELAHKLRTRVAELEAQHRWISINERLPELDQDVFAIVEGDIDRGHFYQQFDGEIYFSSDVRGAMLIATHWMDIPDLPEEVQE